MEGRHRDATQKPHTHPHNQGSQDATQANPQGTCSRGSASAPTSSASRAQTQSQGSRAIRYEPTTQYKDVTRAYVVYFKR